MTTSSRRGCGLLQLFWSSARTTPFIINSLSTADDIMLTVFATLAHRNHPEINSALDTLADALAGIDLESAKFFAEYVEVGLDKGSARTHWKGIIMTMTYSFTAKFQEELKAEGLAEGREEGREEGRAETLISLLALRGVALTSDQRQQVLECRDEQIFLEWLQRAMTATNAADVFESTPRQDS
ncbi:hypothetical protein FAB82_15615 [Glycomyces buryatensis]|uniref:Uncharacterized protein n=1 Tax=Glycomyces buryatensis TaxID=2570927 RepID=A0A4S8QCH0_9ACTN|nr:hypothetical protein FAB82_15615 [Glycomyces buryatensis]